MTTFSAKVILDSIGIDAPRLLTLQLRYPLIVHAELMTHRVFSRNARSSRAVPTAKMIEEVENDPFIPVHWGANQPGMQAFEECEVPVCLPYEDHIGAGRAFSREGAWLQARDAAVRHARGFMEAGYAKQIANRLLMPFLHIDTLVTATEFQNWYDLRDHGDADPHIRPLAVAMREAVQASTPKRLTACQWHLPYVTEADYEGAHLGATAREVEREMCFVSAARCARISYAPFVESEIAKDVALAGKLALSKHWSPFEHQAKPDETTFFDDKKWKNAGQHRNLYGWRQHRAMIDTREAA